MLLMKNMHSYNVGLHICCNEYTCIDLQENLLRLQMERSLIIYKKRLVLIWMQRLMREGANDVYVDTVDEG